MRLLLILLSLMPSLVLAAEPVTVFAAASLTDALKEIGKAYEAAGHGKIVASFASSSDLARQIERGAPADLFISADELWADYLDQHGLIDKASRITLVKNDLVLVASAASTVELTVAPHFALAAALKGDRLAMGDPDHVPAGIYGKVALQNLGVWDELESKIARAASVRAALLFVERGECPFGIVYLTDALADPKVKIVGRFPANTHPPIRYPAALVAGRKSPEGVAFLHYLQTPAAAAVFRRFGFETEG
jgi:molybdate transport system substrate-binding protein